MQIVSKIFLMLCLWMYAFNACADCKFGNTTLKSGDAIDKNFSYQECAEHNIPTNESADKGRFFKVICANTSLICAVKECFDTNFEAKSYGCVKNDRAAFLREEMEKKMAQMHVSDSTYVAPSASGEYNPLAIQMASIHENTLGYTGKKITVIDACDLAPRESLSQQASAGRNTIHIPAKTFTVMNKYQAICLTKYKKLSVSTDLAMAIIISNKHNSYADIGNIKYENCSVRQDRYTPGHDKYIRCKTDKNIYVEFEFADMDNFTKLLDFGQLASDLCPAFDMKYNSKKTSKNVYATCEESSGQQLLRCSLLASMLNNLNLGLTAKRTGNDCIIFADYSHIEQQNSDELNTNFFRDIVLKPASSVKSILEKHYIKTQISSAKNIKFGQPMIYTKMDNMSTIGQKPKRFLLFGDSSYGWPVQIDGKLFILKFRGVLPDDKDASVIGAEQIACVITGGIFDGQNCFLVNEKECEYINTIVSAVDKKGGAKFNNTTNREIRSGVGALMSDTSKKNVCELKYSTLNAREKEYTRIGTAVAGMLLVAAGTVTGGSSAVVGLALIGTIAGGVASGTEIVNIVADKYVRQKTLKFLIDSSRCNPSKECQPNSCVNDSDTPSDQCVLCTSCHEAPKCAEDLFVNNFDDMISLGQELNEDEIDATDAAMTRLLTFMPCNTDYIEKFQSMLKQDNAKSVITWIKDVATGVGDVASIASLFNPKGFTALKKAKFVNNLSKTAKAAKTVSRLNKSVSKASDMLTIKNIMDKNIDKD